MCAIRVTSVDSMRCGDAMNVVAMPASVKSSTGCAPESLSSQVSPPAPVPVIFA